MLQVNPIPSELEENHVSMVISCIQINQFPSKDLSMYFNKSQRFEIFYSVIDKSNQYCFAKKKTSNRSNELGKITLEELLNDQFEHDELTGP